MQRIRGVAFGGRRPFSKRRACTADRQGLRVIGCCPRRTVPDAWWLIFAKIRAPLFCTAS